jgi:Flp pilus assembly protein TadD
MKRKNIVQSVILAMTFSVAFGFEPSPDKTVAAPAALIRAASDDLRKGDAASAERALRRAVKLGTRDPLAYNLLGFICDQTGRPDEAIPQYQHALQLSPNYNSRAE